jgi:hypothetical protein
MSHDTNRRAEKRGRHNRQHPAPAKPKEDWPAFSAPTRQWLDFLAGLLARTAVEAHQTRTVEKQTE